MIRNRQSNSNSVLRRLCKKTLIILVVIGIPMFLLITFFHIKDVEVVGANRYTQEQIKDLVFESYPDSNSLYLYLKYRYFDKPTLPFVEKIDVEIVNSHRIKIFVYEKMVAGCVEFMGEYLYFDKDGMVVESSSQRLDKVPIIKGLKFNEVILNEKLKIQKDELQNKENANDQQTDEQKDDQGDEQQDGVNTQSNEKVFDTIINLTQLIDKYELDVDTISFGSNNEVTLDSAGITVLLGKKSTYDEALAELKNILKEAKGMEITIDMRNFVKGTDSIAKLKKSTD